eukprot:TRINITY_DN10552_c0_g1_i1.p1 TRINITY_DN10552_c0_g1~~TRINITY_DN10552_c0_g1_i1.p1  ORF type:complete len:1436 (-),score=591.02 TRINITY_DN10552_c0_g1_i1:100-4407(-)
MESLMEASMDSSTDTNTMSKNEKYKLSFKQSKQKVKDWEGEFFRSNQRKPDKEEMRSAPENVQIAYKNCYKIKAYFAKAENASDTTSEVFNEDSQTLDTTVSNTKNESKHTSFSGVLSNTTSTLPSEIPCADISNLGKVWGKHLNHKPRKTTSLTSYDKMSSKLGLQLSQVTSSSTRTSLKKRKNKFQSFTDTLGDSSANDSTLENNSLSTSPSAVFPTSTPLPPPPTRSPSPEYQLFPSLVTGKVVTGPAKVPTMVTSKLDRKVDPSWLERCAGVGGEGGDNDLVGGGGDHGANQTVDHIANHTEPSGEGDTERETSVLKAELRPATEVSPASSELRPPSELGPATELRPSTELRPATESQLATEVMVRPATRISKKTDTVKTLKKVATPVVPFDMDVDEDASTAETGGESDNIDNGLDIDTNKSDGKIDTIDKGSVGVKEKSKNSKENKKRKRESESGEENYSGEGDDNDESDNNTETEMDAKPKKKTAQKAEKKAAKPRKKKVKKVESSDEEDDVASAVVDGPSDMNLYALGFEEGDVSAKQSVRKVQTAQERLASKVNSGKASDNFLKIDIKKKSYSRGKGGSSGEMIKRKEWQRKVDMKAGKKVKEFKCYRCGELGHFSRQCTGGKGDALIPSEMADEFDPGEFPTLDEARDMATGIVKKDDSKVTRLFTVKKKEEGEQENVNLDFETVDDALLLEAAMQYECAPVEDATAKFAVPPLISSIKEDRQFVYTALARFGYEQFREGQEEAIMRILAGQSSLILLATGTGKSLIYQLPALLYGEKSNCITLVVSPLVSLMEDQITGLPPFLKAAALHYNMTASQKEKVVQEVKSGKLHFLLVSPEAVAGGGGAFGSLLPNLPPIAFVCIDEAHCVSHWSHNFRPSYLRLSKIIREKLGVKTILGLTATAPESLTRSVAEHLGVPDDGVIRGPLLPGNLTMTVSKDAERDKALLAMLTEGTLADCDSVIIYCTRREVCERLATVVRTQLQARDIQLAERRERKTRVSATAEPYHAGLSSYRRKTVQSHFMSGKLRIVIATVAFGMGIDKSDIRAIVHYNMPRTFESYIQEIGRAGRDGKPARGHLFLDSRGGDLTELKRHIFANSMDRHTLRKLLHAVFPQSCTETDRQGGYHEMAVSVDKLVEQLDLPEENISTLLCYLENYSPPYIKLSNPVYCMAKVQCYGGPRQLRQVAAKCPPLAAAIALLRQAGQQDLQAASSVEFQVVEVSAKMGWESAIVKKELKNLEWSSTPTGWKKTGVLVEFSDLAFHFSAATGLEEGALDELLEQLYTRVSNREKTELWGLTRLAKAFTVVAYDKQVEGGGEEDKEKSDKLKVFIREYFEEPERLVPEVLAPPPPCQHEDQVRAEIRAFVCQHQEHDWSGRAVARVFHGIQSPNYPAKQWGRVFRSWRSHLDTDFNLLVQFAKEEILSLRRG